MVKYGKCSIPYMDGKGNKAYSKKKPMLISNPVHVPPLISGFWGPRFDGELSFRGGP